LRNCHTPFSAISPFRPTPVAFWFWMVAIPVGVKLCLMRALTCISLMAIDVGHFYVLPQFL
jgi:hypothetical protein